MQLNCKNRSSLLVAAAVICALASVPLLTKSATAADLGGDCCADLEERVAELEANGAKDNKKVSVTLYGQVNRAALFLDDGAEKNAYVVDNNYKSSRFGVKGSAKTGLGDWLAGYRLEVEPTEANSAKLNQFDDNNTNDSAGPLNVRHSYLHPNIKKYGEGPWASRPRRSTTSPRTRMSPSLKTPCIPTTK